MTEMFARIIGSNPILSLALFLVVLFLTGALKLETKPAARPTEPAYKANVVQNARTIRKGEPGKLNLIGLIFQKLDQSMSQAVEQSQR